MAEATFFWASCGVGLALRDTGLASDADFGSRYGKLAELVWGRSGLEPPTSAVRGPERSTNEFGMAIEKAGVVRLDTPARGAAISPVK